ncbi:MAG TPA: HNH endonuclease signature motif containing protein [Bryobacteraceae bacterium]|nr:HNH endonuclease signature motif containing protein [Bryobacteraceae bacterium]
MPKITVSYAKNIIRRALREIVDPSPEPDQLELAWKHFESRCAYCGVVLTRGSKHAHFDHLISAAGGGVNHISNRVLCCSDCNEKEKLDRPWDEFLRCKTGGATEYEERLRKITDWITMRAQPGELLSNDDSTVVDGLADEVNVFFQTRVDKVRELRARTGRSSPTGPANVDSIRDNIFDEAHFAIEDWAGFPWHRPKKGALPDADRPHSSQAFCISVWGAFAAQRGGRVRAVIAELLNDESMVRAVATSKAVSLRLEDVNRRRLNEFPAGWGNPTQLDAVVSLSDVTVVVESKLTETLGRCSQPPKQCSGDFKPGSDIKTKSNAPCRLGVQDGQRTPRLYWDVIRQISRPDAYPEGGKCPFAGPGYQTMRVIASAVQVCRSSWRVVFAYPFDQATRREIDSVVERLLPEYQDRILHLDYVELARALSREAESDPIARDLGAHMSARLRMCGLL